MANAKRKRSEQPSLAVVPDEITDEMIAKRAYEIWVRRGSPLWGDDERDWYAARNELEQERLRKLWPAAGKGAA